jgi:hypothetical protein
MGSIAKLLVLGLSASGSLQFVAPGESPVGLPKVAAQLTE